MEEERLQKILSKYGYGSRRDCEKIIAAGRVKVNDLTAKLGDKADPQKDKISVDGDMIKGQKQTLTYIAFYKPRKVLSEIKKLDERKIVTEFINIDNYYFIVGRLDFDSEGLILLTNDGNAANKLTHPRYEHEKEYHVEVFKSPDPEQLNVWRKGVVLEDGYKTLPAKVDFLQTDKNKRWLKVILREGKKRQIREIGERIGIPVRRIIRVRIGPIEIGSLKPGDWRYLSTLEIANLRKSLKAKS